MKFILLASILSVVTSIDAQLQLEYQNTLNYIVKLANNSKLQQLQYEYQNKCVSHKCCLCGKSFKSQSASAIHFNIHHQDSLTFDLDIAILFDESVPSEKRFDFCQIYLEQWFRESLNAKMRKEVCYVTSWNMHKQQAWIQIVKYILYIFLGIVALVYYAEILKPWK